MLEKGRKGKGRGGGGQRGKVVQAYGELLIFILKAMVLNRKGDMGSVLHADFDEC